ncbi:MULTISPECIES: capsid cement protein [Pseudoalteromonas]|uniref:capsid cement protein n=1 Tax=Pseudoalteromonas TaxID=53246 RepID=UPI001B38F2A3|nr:MULTISPECIES: capsid cement protein [Pseudoalteromonas]MBQ4838837.1 DUF2190 family protein [Pseudoalteromonas luteoviolacea]MCG7548578.1 DUF2190 family protein [Pseudoalteromonas sp. Of7M-16]
MKNYIQDGKSLEFTAPTGGVVSGNLYIIGSTVVIASVSAEEGERFNGRTEGVFELPKVASVSAGEGDAAKWLTSSKSVSSASGSKVVGVFAVPAIATETTCTVRLVQTVVA